MSSPNAPGDQQSLLFSLDQLMNMEQQRQREEREAAERHAALEARNRAERERAAREAEEAAIEVRRRETEQRQTHALREQARLEGIRLGEVTKARAEAESIARREAMERQHFHDRELAEIQRDRTARRLRRWLWGVGGATSAVIAVAAGVYFLKVVPDRENDRIERERQATAQAAALDRASQQLDAARTERIRLQKLYDEAKTETQRLKLQEQIDKNQEDIEARSKKLPWSSATKVKGEPAEPPPPCVGDPNDPLNPCL